ncbi:gliding motility-associated C-terminal domain-containing protein [Capnocytophaga sp. oral taxon 864]|uniref:T9SS type B sorting domain-containing protein n=1 Tax=Capnocytophaga sp. oral taxon 864 TaxID=1316593 RepID=UPI00352A7E54
MPPYTFELSEAEIDGSTTNAVYQNNADNNFFINIDASKPQARYKFLVKDSCGKGKVYEETLSQIAPLAVQKSQDYYCVGSKGVLSVPQISGVSYQWYRNDQPTTVLSTNNELVINNLTQADLDNTFSLKLTLTQITDPNVKNCIEQNLNGFDTIRFNAHAPYSQTYKAPVAVNRVECLDETNNSVNNIYDVNKLFKNVPTSFESGISYDIIDKDGLISTTKMDYVGIKDMIKMSPALVGKHTFIYRIKSACGSVITQTEATLEVKTYKGIPATSINVCEATKTLAELETIIKNTNAGITTSIFGNNFEFQWYPTSADAINETNRITAPSLSLSEGNNQYYIKGKHVGDSFCFSSPAQVNITRLSSSSKGDKTITLCEGTIVTDLKKEIAKPSTSDVNKIAVYKGTTLLSNDDVLQTGIQYTYTYKVGTCETPSANINLTLTPITPIPPVESVTVCDYEVENLSYYTTYAVVMNYLQTKYAGKTVKLYRSFGPNYIPQVKPTDKIYLNNDSFSYTLQEAGKCESAKQKIIVVADINRAIATSVAISVCEEDKVSAIRAKLTGNNIKIYKRLKTNSQQAVLSMEVNDNDNIDWTAGMEYFYTIKNTGDTCESRKERIYLSKSLGGKTLAQPVSLSLCNSNATIGDLKVALQGNEVKIYTLNGQNKYVEEADATALNAVTNYYYTLRDIGKCVSEKAPITFTLLQRPVTPTVTQTTQSFCSNATIASLQPQGANIVWYATATSTTPLANTTPLVAGSTYYVAQRNGSCESLRTAVNVVYSNTLSLTVPAPLTIACDDANIATTVGNWLNQATVTDTCGTATLTHNYTAVKPTDWCNTSIVTITFVGKDPLGNTVTKTSTIKVLQIDAVDDTHTGIINGANGANDVIDVLQNDRVGGTQATISNVQLTIVTPATGGTNISALNTATGKISVPAGTKSGTYTIQYKICHTENSITVCDTATATVKVGSTPIVAKADTYTVTNGTSTTTTTGTVLDNDKLGTKIPTTTDVILTVVTTATDVVGATKTPTLNNNGTVTVPSGTKSGTYHIVYSICERLNPNNCATATATVKVGSTPIVAKADTYTITNGTSTTITTGTVLDNDKLGTKTPTTVDVILTVVTTTTDVVGATKTPTLNNNGTVTVPSGTKSGTYEIVYSICERLNPDNCATATATVKVFVPTVVTPTTIEAVNDGVTTITSTIGGTTPSVLTNDKLNGVPNPSISSVTLTWNTATPTGFTLNPNGTITVAPNTPVGIHTISYTICAVASPTVCSTASIVVTVSGTTTSTTPVLPIAVDDRSTTTINTPVVVNVLGNDIPNGATTPNVVATPANGTVVVNVDGSIEYRPNTNFEGTDTFVYKLCNTDGCASATVTVDVVNKIVPYNGMSVNGDGKNDYFHIGGIERYPNNVVRIYNRWGVKVFETEGYDNVTRVFRGISNGRVTIEQADKLPQGTYYYVIEYYDSNNNKESLVGWLYIKK